MKTIISPTGPVLETNEDNIFLIQYQHTWQCHQKIILDLLKSNYFECKQQEKKYFWSLRSKTSASILMTAPIADRLSIFTKLEYGY
jgi:hypothetical protein